MKLSKFRRLAGIVGAAAVTAACTASPQHASPPTASGSTATPSAQASGSLTTPGGQLWFSRYDGQTGSYPVPAAIAASPDGSAVFVTGTSGGRHKVHLGYVTVGYDPATGRQQWVRRYIGLGKSGHGAAGIVVSPDGRIVFVTGTSTLRKTGYAFATIAYSASTGRRLWLRQYDGPGDYAYASALAVSPDGATVIVTGVTGGEYGPQANDAYTIIAYDAATGVQRWISRLTGPAHGNNQARNIAISPDSSTVYVTGRSYSPKSKYDDLTVAYNAASGAQRWASRYNGPANGNDFANAVAVAPDGKSVYVTGGSRGESSMPGITPVFATTIAYNAASGARRWVARSSGGGTGGSLAVTPDGRSVIVAGPGIGIGQNAYSAVVYNAATGEAAWTRRVLELTCCGILSSQTLAVSPDSGTIYITGSPAGNCCESGTVAYAVATGKRLWQSVYDGPGNRFDWVGMLALSPGGSTVYVTGRMNSGGVATIAYRT